MKINYKILEVDASRHAIVVRFTTDTLSEDDLAIQRDLDGRIMRCKTDVSIDLPVPTPTADELESIIIRHANINWFTKEEAIKNPAIDTSMTALMGLVDKEISTVIPEPTPLIPIEFVIPEKSL